MLGPLSPHASWRWHPVDEVDDVSAQGAFGLRYQRESKDLLRIYKCKLQGLLLNHILGFDNVDMMMISGLHLSAVFGFAAAETWTVRLSSRDEKAQGWVGQGRVAGWPARY